MTVRSSASSLPPSPGRRAAIVAGLRTPFVRAGTDLAQLDVLDLAVAVSVELLQRSGLDPYDVDHVIYGNVTRPVQYSNLARELVLAAGLPKRTPADTVTLACASAAQAITDATNLIERGYADVVLAGGVEMLSNVPIGLSPPLARALVSASQSRSMAARLQSFRGLSVADLPPVTPSIAETSTGLSMGQSAELMAKLNGISRADQDAWALGSHRKAAAAWADGRMAEEVAPVYVADKGGRAVVRDNHIRPDTSLEKLAQLKPVFDRQYGTVTAGNASPLTDGAASVLLMTADRARALGLPVRAFVRSYAYTAVDPAGQLLIGPAYAIPLALERAGLQLSDIDVVEMHEAFAAQVLSTLQKLESRTFANEELGRSEAVGCIDPNRMNLHGGSIALGHPFGATGARCVTTVANEMERQSAQFGLVSVCAAGGVGVAVVLERA
ncbi:MAG: acetyl-CoA C-acyltransferase [Chloroflexota bacterium]|nr:acetyl-CoA C-acyltransferase [Chloroflexota bacterium]